MRFSKSLLLTSSSSSS